MSPFLLGCPVSPSGFRRKPLHPKLDEDPNPPGTTTLRLGMPGDVGGLANGAELMECEPRLWVYGALRGVGT